MATKNISLTEEAYNRLRMIGRENESFSEIVVRITKKSDIDDYVGILSNEAANELEANIKRLREKHRVSHKVRMQKIIKELRNGLS